jgi:hypothetical protein
MGYRAVTGPVTSSSVLKLILDKKIIAFCAFIPYQCKTYGYMRMEAMVIKSMFVFARSACHHGSCTRQIWVHEDLDARPKP